MYKKIFLFLSSALLFLFASCSFLNLSENTSSVTLKLPGRTARIADGEYEDLLIDLSLKGDSKQSQTIPWTSEASVTFERIKTGSKIYIEAQAYINEPGLEEKIILYTGSSDEIKVTPGENNISLSLKKIYIVYFDLNEGEGEISEQRIVKGGKVSKPSSNPTREGSDDYAFAFDGWYTASGYTEAGELILSANPFDFANTPVTEDITLYAKWLKKNYITVIFDSRNGSTAAFDTQKIPEGDTAKAPKDEPEKEDDEDYAYIFNGWYTSTDEGKTLSEKPFDFNTPITEKLTLYAGWTQIPYVTVSFNLNGGIGEYEEKRILKGQTIERPSNPGREADEDYAYIFVDWFTSDDEGKTLSSTPFNFNDSIEGNITLYAGWKTSAFYKVSFNTMGGSGTFKTQRIAVGYPAEEPKTIPEKEGNEDIAYEFIGWFTSSDNGETLSSTPYDFTSPVTSPVNLYAKWEEKIAGSLDAKLDVDEFEYINVSGPVYNADNDTYTFTAETGFDSYLWKYDGIASGDSNIFITPIISIPGAYDVTLLATKNVDGQVKYYFYHNQIKYNMD